ncbi:MAG TPA: amidohydrolase family protein [Ruminiclostridium sp.]|nr:amidohydrolase family protein [Ruminiclostridium sp.]
MPLPQPIINTMAAKGCVSVPTMGMMKGIVESVKKLNPQVPFNYEFVRESVAAMHKSGIKILAGTDSNNDPTAPCAIQHGFGLQNELSFMVDAGLTPVEALQSATSKPAEYFGLKDRGVIAVGRRADLLLVEGDPTTDIRAIRNINGVWIGGKAVLKQKT